MNLKRKITINLALAWGILALTGCSESNVSHMANELRFSLDEISSLEISYDEENITFFESDNDDFVIKEYMSKNKKRYYAKTKQSNNTIHISEGEKPLFKDGFTRYVEVYLPANYQNILKVTSTKGDIICSGLDLNLSCLRIDSTSGRVVLDKAAADDIHLTSTSGTMTLGYIKAAQIRLETTSGSISCKQLNGNVEYISTSGNINVESAVGAGSYRANNSGTIRVIYTQVNGNLSLFNKNDSIALTLPADLEFKFEAAAKNGSVSATFQKDLTVNGRISSGIVGNNPTAVIKLETNNGSIEVTQ